MTTTQDEDLLDEELPDEDEDAEDGELSLDELEEAEEEESTGHKVQTIAPDADGVDDYFDEKYFDE